MTLAARSLRQLRVIYFAFLFAAAAYLAVPLMSPPLDQRKPPFGFVFGAAIVSLIALSASAFVRARMAHPAGEALRNNPEDASSAQRWRTGMILSLVFCETVVLFGLALRYTGVPWSECGVFYAVGIFLLLISAPRQALPRT